MNTSKILEVEEKNNILGAKEKKMLEIFKDWIKEDAKYIPRNQMFHFGHLYSQWEARVGKLDPDLCGTVKDINPLALSIVESGGSEKGNKGRKLTKYLIREAREFFVEFRVDATIDGLLSQIRPTFFINIISWNIGGLNSPSKIIYLEENIVKHKPIIFLL